MKRSYKTTLLLLLFSILIVGMTACGEEYTPPEYKPGTGGSSDLIYYISSYGSGYKVYSETSDDLVYYISSYGNGYKVYSENK